METQDTQAGQASAKPASRHPFLARLARSRFKRVLPFPVRRFLKQRVLPYHEFMAEVKRAQLGDRDVEEVSTYPAKADATLGIVKEVFQHHAPFVRACREMGVPYRLVDISGPDWVEAVRGAPVDAFLAWPSIQLTVLKRMHDDRLRLMVECLGKIVYPTWQELWLYESKHRMHYWLAARGFPQPRTWVFHSYDEARDFAASAELPIVFKTDLGATSAGVRIFRARRPLLRFVRRVFRGGIERKGGDPRDRQWGAAFFQEYLPEVTEWRAIRINRTYFAHQKGKIGDFHSGTNIVIFANPPRELLDLVRRVTEAGPFTSMDVDIFETRDGRYLINELQTLFGGDPCQMKVDGRPGRYLYDKEKDQWLFEEGMFNRNECCNLRVERVLEMLGKPVPPWCRR
jgi:hypothetical protein